MLIISFNKLNSWSRSFYFGSQDGHIQYNILYHCPFSMCEFLKILIPVFLKVLSALKCKGPLELKCEEQACPQSEKSANIRKNKEIIVTSSPRGQTAFQFPCARKWCFGILEHHRMCPNSPRLEIQSKENGRERCHSDWYRCVVFEAFMPSQLNKKYLEWGMREEWRQGKKKKSTRTALCTLFVLKLTCYNTVHAQLKQVQN